MPTLTPRGAFRLQAAATFGFGPTEGRVPAFDGTMRLAFPLDGGTGYAGATLTQAEPDAPVRIELQIRNGGDERRALAQAARIVSLDHDGEEFANVGRRDPVVAALQRAHPGQRPVLFHSPYEAAAWSIISARRPSAQAANVRHAIAEEHGEPFELAGRELHAFPQPARLSELPIGTPGLNAEKVERLHGVARAALRGELDVGHLHALGPERAFEHLQDLKGIGPFYAGLIVLRASGFADAMLPAKEPRVLRRAGELYGLHEPPTFEQFVRMAETWRPFRTWAMVLIRLGGDRASGAPTTRSPEPSSEG
ncbi:MAG: DNA-3-methyladenine glycosylase 2 family protein [Solirubrobacterales bacterium]|nr:DNA-3-methyladenine glycosylase 2 family protein [Solirubrobacterales bacterium]